MINFQNLAAKNVIITSIALLLLFLVQGSYLAMPGPIWSVFAFFIFGLYVCSMACFLPVSFILLLPYTFFRATTLISGIAIEYGGFISDLGLQGEATGAYIRLAMVYIIFISSAGMVIEFICSRTSFTNINSEYVRERTQRHPWVWIFFAIFILFTAYILVYGYSVGFPLLKGTDRLGFMENSIRAYSFYMGNRVMAAFLFGIIIYLCNGLRRNIAIVFFIIMIITSVLFGEKFTSLVSNIIYMITPAYLMSKPLQKRILYQVVPAILGIALLTIPLILFIYGWSENPYEAKEKLLNRMVGQGELWFVADRNMYDAFVFDGEALNHIFKSSVLPNGEELVKQPPYIGAHYFMHNYMPPDLLSVFLSQSYVTLTLALEPYLLEVFGRIGMIIPLVFFAAAYALFLSYLAWAILNARPISILFAGKLLKWVVLGLNQGHIYAIIGFRTLLFSGTAALYEAASYVLSSYRKSRERDDYITDKQPDEKLNKLL